MTHSDVPASSAPSRPQAAPVPAPRSWSWRRTALLLAGAAQLITISALLGSDPVPVTWASLLLAIAPAPLAAAAAFAPPPRPGSRRQPGGGPGRWHRRADHSHRGVLRARPDRPGR